MPTTGSHGIIIPDPSTSGAIINHVRDLAIQTENALNDVAAHVATGIGIENYATKTYVNSALSNAGFVTEAMLEEALQGGTYVTSVNGHTPDVNGDVFIDAGGVDIKVGGSQPAAGWWLDDGSPEPVGPTVTPTAPTFTDLSGTANDTYTIPTRANVRYLVDGVVKAAGTYPASGTVTVTAQGLNGYTLTGYPAGGWSHTYSTVLTATPLGPTWVPNTDTGGGTWTASQTGVVYTPASGTAQPGQTITVTATPAAGYVFTPNATTSWTHTFPTAPPPDPTIIDTFSRTVAAGLGVSDSGHAWTWIIGTGSSVDGEKAIIVSGNQYSTPELSTWNLDISAEVGLGTASPSGGQGACIYIGDAANYLRVHRDPSGATRVALNNGGFTPTLASRGTSLPVVGTLRMVLDSPDGKNGTLTLFDGATQLGDPVTLAMTNPLPKKIFLGGTGSGTYTFDNFTVTEFI